MHGQSRPTAKTAAAAALVSLLALVTPVAAELPEEYRAWNQPIEPFRVIANVYYVGSNEIAAFLFATPEGHILLDGGFAETAPLVAESVERLGYRLADVKLLINSHAHLDHAGGLAELKRLSGATLLASTGDAPLLVAGGEEGWRFPAVKPDRLLRDGDTAELGGTVLTARVTAGHTPGCTTWTTRVRDGDRDYDVVFVCSVNALPEMDLLREDPAYPGGRAAAFERSFEVLESLPCDVFLGPHASFFLLDEKLARLAADAPANPFVDPELYRRHVAAKHRRFEEELQRQKAAAAEPAR